ncbi:MAG: type II toxin-antitoxin system Phd/YefM family antitoxin [Gemmatimonadota bacterium]
MTMSTVQVAELKAKLSEYLRRVRRGHSITVLHRDHPIARLIPYERTEPLSSREPLNRVPTLGDVPLPPPLDLPVDILDVLEEERQSHR